MLSSYVKNKGELLKLLALRRLLIEKGVGLRRGFYFCLCMLAFIPFGTKMLRTFELLEPWKEVHKIVAWIFIVVFGFLLFCIDRKRKLLKKDYCNVQLKIDMILLTNLYHCYSKDLEFFIDEDRIRMLLCQECIVINSTLVQDIESDFFRRTTDLRFLDSRIEKAASQVKNAYILICIFIICTIVACWIMKPSLAEDWVSILSMFFSFVKRQYLNKNDFVSVYHALKTIKYNLLTMGNRKGERKYNICRSLNALYNNSNEDATVVFGILLNGDDKIKCI